MTELLAQIALLMLGAYLIGAILGCLLRRLHDYVFGRNGSKPGDTSATASAGKPMIEVSDKAAKSSDQSRFERALSHGPASTPASDAQAPARSDTQPVKLDTPSFAPVEKPTAPTSKPAATADEGVEGEKFSSVSVAAAAAAAAIAARASEPSEPAPAPAPAPKPAAPQPAPVAPPSASPAPSGDVDNLMRIRGIDGAIQTRLYEAGVTRYEQIAGWQAPDVSEVDAYFANPGRVSHENWIEQAQILATGGLTSYAREMDAAADAGAANSDGASASPAPVANIAPAANDAVAAPAPAAPPQPEAVPQTQSGPETAREDAGPADLSGFRSVRSEAFRSASAGPSGEFDDLKRVRGVGVLIEKKLNALGVTTYEQIANWTNQDIDHVSQQLEFKGRIERENWVEQARILASGGQTEFSRRLDRKNS